MQANWAGELGGTGAEERGGGGPEERLTCSGVVGRPSGWYSGRMVEKGGPILVVSPRWQTRALFAAELGERLGRDVVSAPDVEGALGLIKMGRVDPAAVVVDAEPGIGPADVERLLEAIQDVPVVLVVGPMRKRAFEGLRGRVAVWMVRPVTVGSVVRAVEAVVA